MFIQLLFIQLFGEGDAQEFFNCFKLRIPLYIIYYIIYKLLKNIDYTNNIEMQKWREEK